MRSATRRIWWSKHAYVPGGLDVPHSWAAIRDVARTLVTLATDERACGRAWHVPAGEPRTERELAREFAVVAGAPEPRLSAIPYPVLWTAGLLNPFHRAFRTARYQFDRPFILDSTLTTKTFGIEATPDGAGVGCGSRAR